VLQTIQKYHWGTFQHKNSSGKQLHFKKYERLLMSNQHQKFANTQYFMHAFIFYGNINRRYFNVFTFRLQARCRELITAFVSSINSIKDLKCC
jgi:hypothetical protein